MGSEPGELLRDIIAALDEAEIRIQSLEVVLSKLTPSDTEGTPPNYSHLLAACRSSIDIIRHLNYTFLNSLQKSNQANKETTVQKRTEDILNRWEKIEETAIRELEKPRNLKQFFEDLTDIQKWLLNTLQTQPVLFTPDADMEVFFKLLQKHETLVAEIFLQKERIRDLNATGQIFTSSPLNPKDFDEINEKLKSINADWSKLCTLTLEWQNRLGAEFFQSSEFDKTLNEIEVWLAQAEEKMKQVTASSESVSTAILQEQRIELFALKQRLNRFSLRIKTLLDVSRNIFIDGNSENPAGNMDGVLEVKTKLIHIMDRAHFLLQECSKALISNSKLLMIDQLLEKSSGPAVLEENQPSRLKRCCYFLLRVAKASIPIQAALLLILGAAILLPKDEEELSSQLSDKLTSRLNSVLPPPPPV